MFRTFFDVSLTVHLNITLTNDQLDAQIFKCIYYIPIHVHVSSSILLILRRSNCINTASGIVTLSKWSGWNILILLASCQQTCMTYTIAVCTVKTPDDGQRNCRKHVEFHSKNKFEKLVHLVGFIIRNSESIFTCSVRVLTKNIDYWHKLH